MDREERICLLGLSTLALFLTALLVSKRAGLMETRPEQESPFVSDRVVEVRIVMDEDDWQELKTNAVAKQYVRADFWFDGEPCPNVAVRPKGNSSLKHTAFLGTGRVGLKIDFNFFSSAQTFRGLKKLNFNNGFSDPTVIRETLGYEMFAQMDLPTPRTALVDLFVNDVHLGLYTQVEQVDKTFLARHFTHPNGNLYKPERQAAGLNWTQAELEGEITSKPATRRQAAERGLAINMGGARLGDLLKLMARENTQNDPHEPNHPAPTFSGRPDRRPVRRPGPPSAGGFPPDPNHPFPMPPFGPGEGFPRDIRGLGGPPPGMRPPRSEGNLLDLMGLKTNENYQNHTALYNLLEVLNTCPDESFPTEIAHVLDVDSTLRFLAVSVALVHLDNYIGSGHNYYLYEVEGKFVLIPWDLNMCLGTFNMGYGQEDIANLYIDEPVFGSLGDRPLVTRILAHPPYLETYHQYLEQIMQGGYAPGVMEARIDELIRMIRPYVEADTRKSFSMKDFEKGIDEGDLNMKNMRGSGRPRPPRGAFATDVPPEFAVLGGGKDGPGLRPRGLGGPPAPGLKSFIQRRQDSMQEQLAGECPSRPNAQERQERNRMRPMMRRPGRNR